MHSKLSNRFIYNFSGMPGKIKLKFPRHVEGDSWFIFVYTQCCNMMVIRMGSALQKSKDYYKFQSVDLNKIPRTNLAEFVKRNYYWQLFQNSVQHIYRKPKSWLQRRTSEKSLRNIFLLAINCLTSTQTESNKTKTFPTSF